MSEGSSTSSESEGSDVEGAIGGVVFDDDRDSSAPQETAESARRKLRSRPSAAFAGAKKFARRGVRGRKNSGSLVASATPSELSELKGGSGSSADMARLSLLPRSTVLQKGWIKVRNTMKVWINRWVALLPGRLVYYKDDKDMLFDRCAGIIQLADCRIKPRHTTKDGHSFKIYHRLRYPIYQKFDLQGKRIKSAMLPLSSSYVIMLVASLQEQEYWMRAINEQIEYATAMSNRPIPKTLNSLQALSSDMEDTSNDEQELAAAAKRSENRQLRASVKPSLQKYVSASRRRAPAAWETQSEHVASWKTGLDSRIGAVERTVTQSLAPKSEVSAAAQMKPRELVLLALVLFVLGWFLE